jgi:hypothetical protein
VQVYVKLLACHFDRVKGAPESEGADAEAERGQDAGDPVVRVGDHAHDDSVKLLLSWLLEGPQEGTNTGLERVALVRGEAVQQSGREILGQLPVCADERLECPVNDLTDTMSAAWNGDEVPVGWHS